MARKPKPEGWQPAWDVVGTAAGITLLTWLFRDQGAAAWTAIGTAPAVIAGLLRKRYFAYSLLLGSAGSSFTGNGYPYAVSTIVAGVFFGAAFSRRGHNFDHTGDDGGEIH